MLIKEKTEEPRSIAASLLAEIELKLAENTQMGSVDDVDGDNSAAGETRWKFADKGILTYTDVEALLAKVL